MSVLSVSTIDIIEIEVIRNKLNTYLLVFFLEIACSATNPRVLSATRVIPEEFRKSLPYYGSPI